MRKGTRIGIVLALIVLVLPARLSWGWFDTGHKVIALIAWEDLTPKTRAGVMGLLKEHPRFNKDLLPNVPPGTEPEEADRDAFAQAAIWPDMIRSVGHPMHAVYSHSQWHFIDIPVIEGAQPPPATAPVDASAAQNQSPRNIVEALTLCTRELKDTATPAAQKAIDLCWVAHLIGDIHQPLHAASLYSPQFPNGDKGGLDEELLRDPPFPDSRANLHVIWDSLPGDFKSARLDRYEAMGLRSDPQFSREQFKSSLDVTDFMAWARESNALAEHDAYLDGHLQAATNTKGGPGGDRASTPGLPPGYLGNAEDVAMHQLALAGYRLADLLNSLFDPKR